MKTIMGVGLIALGIALGLYVGGYLMFIKGIIQLIQGITPEIIASNIAWGLGKIMLASVTGTISAVVFIFPGMAILND